MNKDYLYYKKILARDLSSVAHTTNIHKEKPKKNDTLSDFIELLSKKKKESDTSKKDEYIFYNIGYNYNYNIKSNVSNSNKKMSMKITI